MPLSVHGDLVVIGVDQVGLGPAVQRQRQVRKRVGMKKIVVVEKEQKVSDGKLGGGVGCDRDAAVSTPQHDLDAGLAAPPRLQLGEVCRVAAAVVDDDQL